GGGGGGGEDKPLFQVEFVHMGPGDKPRWARETGQYRYAMGERAVASENGAFLSFRCATGLLRGDPPRLAGNVHVPHTERHTRLEDAARARAAMALLHSVVRAMAQEMGCAKESRVPARLPKPVTTSGGR
ncbi:hypothetical protein, partial [Streptomyces boncukensis]